MLRSIPYIKFVFDMEIKRLYELPSMEHGKRIIENAFSKPHVEKLFLRDFSGFEVGFFF